MLGAIRRLGSPVRRILVVDDDARFARFLTRMLDLPDNGYAITTAHNGREALTRMRAEHPDLVILDLAKPDMDGFGVLGQIAEEPDLRRSKVIVVSAQNDSHGSLPLGLEVRITKPAGFHLDELVRLIGATLAQMSPGRPSARRTAPEPRAPPPG
jgi:CheY-like chemotaxis protein